MPLSSKFFAESTGEKIVKIAQYLAKISTFWLTLYTSPAILKYAKYICNISVSLCGMRKNTRS